MKAIKIIKPIKPNNFLLILLTIVFFYLIVQTIYNYFKKDKFDIFQKPCVDQPYIKYDGKYICFDPLTKKHNTMSVFNHGQQMCEIFPNDKTLTLKDPLNDHSEYTKTSQALCNPTEVYIN
jgi:hypothetical protein